jgi:putative spermidine/putrescine transport system substrate-binding protein
VPENARKFLTEAEWDYWYGGAGRGRHRRPVRQAGGEGRPHRARRRVLERMGNIAVWNSVMDEDRYLTRRWNRFITS